MTVKKTYAIIAVFVLIGIGSGVYYVTKSTRNPSQVLQDQQNNNTTTSVGIVLPARKELTREELVAAEWLVDYKATMLFQNWKIFGDYEIKFDKKIYPDVILVRKADTKQEVAQFSSDVFIPPSPDRIERNERRENVAGVKIIVNPQLEKLYAFFIFGNSHGGGFRKVYESDFQGKNAQELKLERGRYTFPESYRFSPDYTRLSYAANETESFDNQTIYFHIIDLLDPDSSIKFRIPRLASRSDDNNWVAAWRFVNEYTLEFTRYFARGNEVDGYQVSDKELWQYNKQTDRNTLIETIPLKR